MALKPLLKLKVDELFLRWLSEADTQLVLKANLRQIIKGEPLSQPGYTPTNNARSSKPQSPRHRPGSPSTPPCSPAVASPRSPRRSSKTFSRQFNNSNSRAVKEREVVLRPTTTATAVSEPKTDTAKESKPAESGDAFLRKKEAQLKEKRDRERLKEPSDKETKKVTDSPQVVAKATDTSPAPPSSVNNNKLKTVEKDTRVLKEDSQKPQVIKQTNADTSIHIPQFYFPQGQPGPPDELDATIQRVKDEFSKIEGGEADRQHMHKLCKACGRPTCWSNALFNFVVEEKNTRFQLPAFISAWKKLTSTCSDEASQFVHLLAKPGRKYLVDEDFRPLVQDVVDSHPGLSFLQDAPEFHSRYVQTVISRIFYTVNRSWSGKITASEIRKSNLLQTLHILDEEEDINQVMDYFSYEHFYVIYCKFWELDKDHDLYISKEDLAKHNDHAISSRMIERIFSGCVTRQLVDRKMSYKDFVWFLISEEDKRNTTSIEYWFRCMDLDGDGIISMYEMEFFYEEQVQKMESLGIETLPFQDCLCQMLDMVKPHRNGQISLMDLKSCQMTPIFFDTFFNLDKYLEHEQKDPFASVRDGEEEGEMSDWERYAAEEYEILVAEEGANDLQNEEIVYEDDFEADDGDDDRIGALDLETTLKKKGFSNEV